MAVVNTPKNKHPQITSKSTVPLLNDSWHNSTWRNQIDKISVNVLKILNILKKNYVNNCKNSLALAGKRNFRTPSELHVVMMWNTNGKLWSHDANMKRSRRLTSCNNCTQKFIFLVLFIYLSFIIFFLW